MLMLWPRVLYLKQLTQRALTRTCQPPGEESSDITDIATLVGAFGTAVPPARARYDNAPDSPDQFRRNHGHRKDDRPLRSGLHALGQADSR